MDNKVLIAAINWNGKDFITEMIDSLLPQMEKTNSRLLVFDNGSEDGSDDLVEDKYSSSGMVSVFRNGKNIGFRLKALRGESLLKKLNFNENDVFTKINGISLDKPFQALDALKSLTTASSVSVTIRRNGNEETMDFSM